MGPVPAGGIFLRPRGKVQTISFSKECKEERKVCFSWVVYLTVFPDPRVSLDLPPRPLSYVLRQLSAASGIKHSLEDPGNDPWIYVQVSDKRVSDLRAAVSEVVGGGVIRETTGWVCRKREPASSLRIREAARLVQRVKVRPEWTKADVQKQVEETVRLTSKSSMQSAES
ncbi:MAG: hypothetical protein MH204_00815, partial [Fimbriimonadaceae bacterium]|nr:hypothetical protein [Fimbriimonadaceae bacterium]